MKENQLLNLIKLKNTIFTTKDVALLWRENRANFISKKLYRYAKSGKIYSVRKGIYAQDKNYNKYELASKIFTPAYISLETVLTQAGVVFQFYSQIFVVSYLNRELKIDGQAYSFKKIKNSILTEQRGIEIKDNYFVASPERAFLDVLYLNKEYHFDNLASINWHRVLDILPIYGGNKRLALKVKKYQQASKKSKL